MGVMDHLPVGRQTSHQVGWPRGTPAPTRSPLPIEQEQTEHRGEVGG